MRRLDHGHVHVWLAEPDGITDPALLSAYEQLMSPEEKVRWKRYRFEQGQKLHLVSRALLRTTLSQYQDVDPKRWEFAAEEHGRLYIKAPDSALAFNISHTAGLVACAVSLEPEVGVDVEEINDKRGTTDVAQRVFSAEELSELDVLSEAGKVERFFTLWTLKEAYIKARGLGFAVPLKEFGFTFSPSGAADIHMSATLDDREPGWHFHHRAAGAHHHLATAVRYAGQQPVQFRVHTRTPLVPEETSDP